MALPANWTYPEVSIAIPTVMPPCGPQARRPECDATLWATKLNGVFCDATKWATKPKVRFCDTLMWATKLDVTPEWATRLFLGSACAPISLGSACAPERYSGGPAEPQSALANGCNLSVRKAASDTLGARQPLQYCAAKSGTTDHSQSRRQLERLSATRAAPPTTLGPGPQPRS